MVLSPYQEFIALSRYARYNYELGRRETWEETVDRLVAFWRKQMPKLPEDILNKIKDYVYNMKVMPSMRSLMTAGPALERSNVSGYNCAFATISGKGEQVELWDDKLSELGFDAPIKIKLHSPIVFDEAFYILLNGTGFGFSVERQFVADMPTVGKKLSRSIYAKNNKNYPKVPKHELSSFDKKSNTIFVADSKEGWASSLRIFVVEMYNGNFTVKVDTSAVRPAGSPLKVFGGRASGPGALQEMFEHLRPIFIAANGRKLTSIEAHDIMCHIEAAVVVGGVRRASGASLSNLSDDRMRSAKSGEWWIENPQRSLANNSAAYTEKPEIGVFMREWQSLYESRSGERGIFNRVALQKAAAATGRDAKKVIGTNPCFEIGLRDAQFCNLTSIVVREEDTLETLKDKAAVATLLGTMQATLTDFAYLSPIWKENCEDERLLGVSMSGLMDHPVLSKLSDEAATWFKELAKVVTEENVKWAKEFGINKAAAARAIKPEGTCSQLNNTASGLHARFSPYYIRRVRADEKDPLAKVMQQQGYLCEPDVMQKNTLVFSFPVKSPENAVFGDARSALEQLEYWLQIKKNWCDSHNPSITVYVKEHEWMEVGAWVYKNFDDVCGISFLPHSNHVYKQAPYEAITKEQYEELVAKIPQGIDYEALMKLETEDYTTSSQEYACSAGGCELV